MISELLIMNGMGFYVWLSFAISLLACGILYYKTRKTLKKYEREFVMEIEKLSNLEKKAVLKDSKIANQVLSSYKNLA